MNTATTEADFEATIPADGTVPDASLLGVYADFLEERGRPGDARRAWVLRWCAAKGAWPEFFRKRALGDEEDEWCWWDEEDEWCWWDEEDEWCWWDEFSPDHADLSRWFGTPLERGRPTPIALKWNHPTAAAALRALGAILEQFGVLPAPLRNSEGGDVT